MCNIVLVQGVQHNDLIHEYILKNDHHNKSS